MSSPAQHYENEPLDEQEFSAAVIELTQRLPEDSPVRQAAEQLRHTRANTEAMARALGVTVAELLQHAFRTKPTKDNIGRFSLPTQIDPETHSNEEPQMRAEPQMQVEQFEKIAEAAEREDVRLEFIRGRVGVKPVPDGNHGEIAAWLVEQCMQHRPDLRLHTDGRGTKVETYRKGRARPDAVLAPRGYFTGAPEWADVDGVLMMAEITSWDYDTDARDRVEKPLAYAEAGIPVFVLVDRDDENMVVYSNPVDGKYTQEPAYEYGDMVELPGLGIILDTAELNEYRGRR